MAADPSRAAARGPLEWLTGMSQQDGRLLVAGIALVAAGKVAWDLVVHGERDLFAPSDT